MSTTKWVVACRLCGKASGSRRITSNGMPPTSTPSSMVGKCPANPINGKHAPQWIQL